MLQALVMQEGGDAVTFDLNRDYTISVPVAMGPKTITWFLVHSADSGH